MIAASKLKRAQDATLASRPYFSKLSNLSQSLIAKAGEDYQHPYVASRGEGNKTLLLVFAPDKGLCGGLITNLLKKLLDFNKENDATYITLGKKVEHNVAVLNKEIIAAFPFGTTLPSFALVLPLKKIIDEYFLTGKVSSVKILSTNFQSVFTQTPQIIDVLPVKLAADQEENGSAFSLFEPSAEALLSPILEHYLEMTLYQQLLESFVSEQAARMLSMQNATNNALDIIQDLRLLYNKVRQERITSEILDISSAKTVH